MKKPPILEHLHYIAKRTFKGHALYIAVSKITDTALPDKIIAPIRAYEQMETCTRFMLDNHDIILFFNNNKAHHLMLLALKIKEITGIKIYEKIAQSYDLKTDYAKLYTRVYHLVCTPKTNQLHTLSVMQKIPHKPFTFEDLKRALIHLDGTSLTHLIRKQPVQSFAEQENGRTLFTGWFVDLADIRRILIADVDIAENPFFYGLLREAVEKKVLQKIMTFPDWTGGINVSVGLFKDVLMKQWLSTHTPSQRQNILFDFSLDDVLTNMEDYQTIRQALSAQGYRFIIRLHSLQPYLNKKNLPADFVKMPVTLITKEDCHTLDSRDIIAMGVCDDITYNQLIQMGIFQMQGLYASALGQP